MANMNGPLLDRRGDAGQPSPPRSSSKNSTTHEGHFSAFLSSQLPEMLMSTSSGGMAAQKSRRGRSQQRVEAVDQVITRDALAYEIRMIMSDIQEQLCSRVIHAVRSEGSSNLLDVKEAIEQQIREAWKNVPAHVVWQRNVSAGGSMHGKVTTPSNMEISRLARMTSEEPSLKECAKECQHPRDSTYSLLQNNERNNSPYASELDINSLPPELVPDDRDVPFDRASLEPEVKAYLRDISAEEEAELQAQERKTGGCRGWTARLVMSRNFDFAVGFLTLLNSLAIGLQTHYMSVNLTDQAPGAFQVLDLCFAVIFGAEVTARFFVHGLEFFTMDGWRWNIFDFVVVSLQVIEEALQHGALDILWNNSRQQPPNFAAFRVLRVLRLIRILRLVRVLRLVAELRRIIFSFIASLRPFCIAFTLLMMTIYVTGVLLTQLLLDHRVANRVQGIPSDQILEQYYSSLARTILTLFESVAGGLSWDQAVDPLIREISPFMGLLYPMYVAIAMYAMGNVITGVFVEALLENAKETKDLCALDSIRATFLAADSDGSGTVCYEEFQEQLKNQNTQTFLRDLDLQVSEAENMFRLFDHDGDGELQMEAFIRGFLNLRGTAKSVDLRLLSQDVRKLTERFLSFASLVERQMLG